MQSHLRQSGITSKIAGVERGLNARVSRLTSRSSPPYVLRPVRQFKLSADIRAEKGGEGGRIAIIANLINQLYNSVTLFLVCVCVIRGKPIADTKHSLRDSEGFAPDKDAKSGQ